MILFLNKYGLDYQSVKAINPRLVYCSITGFGQKGPSADKAGYDAMIQGEGGLMSLTGEPVGMPMKVGVLIRCQLRFVVICHQNILNHLAIFETLDKFFLKGSGFLYVA